MLAELSPLSQAGDAVQIEIASSEKVALPITLIAVPQDVRLSVTTTWSVALIL